MRSNTKVIAVLALLAAAAPVQAQQTARSGLVADLLNDIAEVEEKLVGLARQFPADKYEWKPADGVRSVGAVMKHVAADNYLLGAALGPKAPAETGIDAAVYRTAVTYEERNISRDEILSELVKSFEFLKKAFAAVPDADLTKPRAILGGNPTHQQIMILTATHLHEHLGQAIAYARSNGITPHWSR